MNEINNLLKILVERKASDLHMSAGRPPEIRVNGDLITLDSQELRPEQIREMAYSIISTKQIEVFESDKELDFSYGIEGLGRFRVNYYRQRGSIGVAVRHIPYVIPKIEDLGLPSSIKDFANKPAGLFLVTGPTGSGKSTTLASVISYINSTRRSHIISIEDPIEYLHEHNKSVVNQREIGTDTLSFGSALKHILRQDPDIILIGELRDLETIQAALTLAETGHLVFATLHTFDTTHSISRIVDVFPPHHQHQVRVQLSMVLLGVISQQLIADKRHNRRVLVYELMKMLPAIRNMIRENDLPQMYSKIHTSASIGMCTMNQSLVENVKKGAISVEQALLYSMDQSELKALLEKK